MHFRHLFKEGRIGTCTLKNRLIMPLYPTKYATDSRVNERMIAFYRERAQGGVAMIVLDCPCLDFPRAYKGINEIRCDTPDFEEGIRNLLDAIHTEGAKAFMQLNYPKERTFDHEVPGAKQKGNKWVVSLAKTMTSQEARDILDIMARGAQRASELGYDGIEIQASYGDFISQLLSPLSNKRTDEFGGSLKNRMRFLTNLVKAVKGEAGKDYPVMVKLVCDEFVEGGLTLEETAVIAQSIARAGADAILVTGGNKATKGKTIPSHYLPPGSLVPLARTIKRAVAIPVIAVGKINRPELADRIIEEGDADFVAMARALIADPFLPKKAEAGQVEDIRGCIYCLEDCANGGVKGLGRSCAVNPFAGQEYRLKMTSAVKKKIVVVVGGGPAGMQSAILASQRGHRVILYEKEESLGGQMRLASRAPFKDEVAEAVRYLKRSLDKSEIRVLTGKAATAEDILSHQPDVVIIATGSLPALPDIPGIDLPFVYDVRSIYERSPELGRKIVVLGAGDTGCETADLLSEQTREVTIVEMLDEPLTRMKEIPRQEILRRLKAKGITIVTGARAVAIEKGMVTIRHGDTAERVLPADSVVVAIGNSPLATLFDSLKNAVTETYRAGDAENPCGLGGALRSAAEIALTI